MTRALMWMSFSASAGAKPRCDQLNGTNGTIYLSHLLSELLAMEM